MSPLIGAKPVPPAIQRMGRRDASSSTKPPSGPRIRRRVPSCIPENTKSENAPW